MLTTPSGLKKVEDTDYADLAVFINENMDLIEQLLNSKISADNSLTLPASTTSLVPLNIPHGATPTTLKNGDIWTTTSGLYLRLNGTTRTIAHTASWSTVSQAEAEAGTATAVRLWTAQRVAQAINALSPATPVSKTPPSNPKVNQLWIDTN